MGTLITFYSYKGGVGRTMALANIAVVLATWGKRVLVVDWDLEAPGIEHFFFKRPDLVKIRERKGLIDLLTDLSLGHAKPEKDTWSKLLIEVRPGKSEVPISLLTSGARSQGYFRSVRQLDVKDFYENKDGGRIIEELRHGWKANFDFVLVDSRTGITDVGGICTIQLPDVLAVVFAATEQSLFGAVEVAMKASGERQKLPFDRAAVPVLPIPGRFDTQTEQKIARKWLEDFGTVLSPIYDAWLPREINRKAFLEQTKIPYAPFFSFGEGLPVVEQGTTDPTSLGFAYETVAALVASQLQNADLLLSNREEFVRLARIRSRLPKTALRELPFDTAIFIDLVASGTLRSLLEQSAGSTKALERVLERYQSVVADCMDREGGVIGMSDGYSFLIGFPSVASAIRCALLVQENLVVQQPIVQEQFGPVRARIAIHMKGGNGNGMTVLLKGASRIASRAQADQVLISGEANKKLVEPLENVSFRARSERVELGSEKQLFDEEILEVERVVPVVFTAEERTSLFKQNPASRSGGGFQAFLVGLQERVNAATNTLELRLSDRERIARYAHDYKGGGWQGRLSKIFGRTLGKDLGRR